MSGFGRVAASVPPGTIIQLATPTVPKGWLPTNGILLPQVGQYSRLYAAIGHTHKKSSETSAALNALGKFRLPNDEQGRFTRAAPPIFDIGSTPVWTGNGITTDLAGIQAGGMAVIYGRRLEQDPADMSGPFWFSRTCDFRTVPAGKYFIPFRITANPGGVLANAFSVSLALKNGADFFRFDMIIERNGSGILEKSHALTKYVGGVVTTQTIPALQTSPVANHVEREWVFFWDTAGNAGIFCDGAYYGSTIGFPTHVTSWTPNLLMGAMPTPIITGGIDFKIIEAAYVEKFDLTTYLPGYSAALEVGKTWGSGVMGGASTHTHTIGGTALTIAQLPPHTHDVTGFVINNNGTSGNGPNDTPTNQSGTKTTTSQGSGQTHTHTASSEYHYPIFIRFLYAIKY